MNARLCAQHMRDGVTIVDPATTYLEPELTIGRDTVIYPDTSISRLREIGDALRDRAARAALERASWAIASRFARALCIDSDDRRRIRHVGPFAHIRGGTQLAGRNRVGNFVEVKNSKYAPRREGGAPVVSRRCDDRRRDEHRRRNDHLQLRRQAQEPDRDRKERLDRFELFAGRAAHDRRRRADRRRLRRDERRCARRTRRRQPREAATEK